MNHSVFYIQPHEGKFRFYTLCSPFARYSSADSILKASCSCVPTFKKSLSVVSFEDVIICVRKVLMEPVIPADVHYQHISPRSVWFVGGVICCGLTRGCCVSPHRLFIQACVQVSRLQQAESDSSQHSPPPLPQLSRCFCVKQVRKQKKALSSAVLQNLNTD